jgi:hypothetical protein
MAKLVSIIIPCYNDDRYISNSINSALKQTYVRKEIIVIDDGSSEKTKSILRSLESQIDLLITQENQGVVAARNNGISKAKGEFILTLDSDDYFDPEFVIKAVDILEQNPQIGMVTCHATIVRNGKKIMVQRPQKRTRNNIIFENGVYASLLFRKQCWVQVNGYDSNMKLGYEDWEFNISVMAAGWGIYTIQEELFFYRDREQSRNKSISVEDNMQLVKYIYKKHKDLFLLNYENMIDFLFFKLEQSRKNEIKKSNTLEFKLGKFILTPVIWIKRKIRI